VNIAATPKPTQDPTVKTAVEDKSKITVKIHANKEAAAQSDASVAAKAVITPNPKKVDPIAPQIKPEIASVASKGGLGDSMSQIEKVLGKPNRINQAMADGIGQYNYQDDLEVVMYIEGRVQSIAYQLDTKKKSMKEKDALEFVKRVMPADTTFVKKIEKDNMERIYVYHSKALEGLFSDDWFKDGDGNVQPGEFSDTVSSFNAAVGGT
jgi:hypothetical protein